MTERAKPGRPRKPDALSSTERSRRHRQAVRIVPVSLIGEAEAHLALARHLFDARDDAKAMRRALEWAVLDAGRDLTPERLAEIIAAEREDGAK